MLTLLLIYETATKLPNPFLGSLQHPTQIFVSTSLSTFYFLFTNPSLARHLGGKLARDGLVLSTIK